ncbi:MAG: hypothetical protein MUO89_07775 [Dehalococcoidia bacterium]|nr:hypothetical protein [Dehalococcoidia bacterium]
MKLVIFDLDQTLVGLLSKKPDYLFKNLEDYRKVLKIIEELPDSMMAPKPNC